MVELLVAFDFKSLQAYYFYFEYKLVSEIFTPEISSDTYKGAFFPFI